MWPFLPKKCRKLFRNSIQNMLFWKWEFFEGRVTVKLIKVSSIWLPEEKGNLCCVQPKGRRCYCLISWMLIVSFNQISAFNEERPVIRKSVWNLRGFWWRKVVLVIYLLATSEEVFTRGLIINDICFCGCRR